MEGDSLCLPAAVALLRPWLNGSVAICSGPRYRERNSTVPISVISVCIWLSMLYTPRTNTLLHRHGHEKGHRPFALLPCSLTHIFDHIWSREPIFLIYKHVPFSQNSCELVIVICVKQMASMNEALPKCVWYGFAQIGCCVDQRLSVCAIIILILIIIIIAGLHVVNVDEFNLYISMPCVYFHTAVSYGTVVVR